MDDLHRDASCASSSAIAPVPSGELSSTMTSSSARPAVAGARRTARATSSASPILFVVGGHDHRQVGRPGRRHPSTIIQAVSRASTHDAPATGTDDRDRAHGSLLVLLLLALRLPSLAATGRRRSVPLHLRRPARPRRRRAVRRCVGTEAAGRSSSSMRCCWRLWPHESMVAAADLVAAAWWRGCSSYSAAGGSADAAGYGAAAIFLLLGDPGLQRLSGLMVRAQCETFIALAVTMALVLTTRPETAAVAPCARRRVARGGGLAEVQRGRLRAADRVAAMVWPQLAHRDGLH